MNQQLFKYIKGLFSVYSQWTDTKRISKEMVGTTVTIVVGLLAMVTDVVVITAQMEVAITMIILGIVGLVFRTTSNGGESVLKPSVRKQINQIKTKNAVEKSLTPDPNND